MNRSASVTGAEEFERARVVRQEPLVCVVIPGFSSLLCLPSREQAAPVRRYCLLQTRSQSMGSTQTIEKGELLWTAPK